MGGATWTVLDREVDSWPTAVGDGPPLHGSRWSHEDDPTGAYASVHANATLRAMVSRCSIVSSRDKHMGLWDIVQGVVQEKWKTFTTAEAIAVALQSLSFSAGSATRGSILQPEIQRVQAHMEELMGPLELIRASKDNRALIMDATSAVAQCAVFIVSRERVWRDHHRHSHSHGFLTFFSGWSMMKAGEKKAPPEGGSPMAPSSPRAAHVSEEESKEDEEGRRALISYEARIKRLRWKLRNAAMVEAVMREAEGVSGGRGVGGFERMPSGGFPDNQFHPPPEPTHLPFARNSSFVGREDLLARLTQRFDEPSLGSPPTVITGPSGVGKTQLALEFAYRLRETGHVSGVLWVDASTNVRRNFIRLVQCLRAPVDGSMTDEQQIATILSCICNTEKPSLVIFDGLVSDGAELAELMPQDKRTHVIVTSKAPLRGLLNLEMQAMSADEALKVLTGGLGREERVEPTTEQTALIRELGGLPLALSLASRLLASGSFTVESLLGCVRGEDSEPLANKGTPTQTSSLRELFEAALDSLVEAQPLPQLKPPQEMPSLTEEVPKTRGRTITTRTSLVSVSSTGSRDSSGGASSDRTVAQSGDLAMAMFDVSAFFGPCAIPFPLLSIAARLLLGSEGDEDVDSAVGKLEYLDLMQRDDDGNVVMHRMLQAYGKSRRRRLEAMVCVAETLAGAACNTETLPHFVAVWQCVQEAQQSPDHLQIFCNVGLSLASFFFESRQPTEAHEVCRQFYTLEHSLSDRSVAWKYMLLEAVHAHDTQKLADLASTEACHLDTTAELEKGLLVYAAEAHAASLAAASDPHNSRWREFVRAGGFEGQAPAEAAFEGDNYRASAYGHYKGSDFTSFMAGKAVLGLANLAATQLGDPQLALEYSKRAVALFQQVDPNAAGPLVSQACTCAVYAARHYDLHRWLDEVMKDTFVRPGGGVMATARGTRRLASIEVSGEERMKRGNLLRCSLDALGMAPITNKVDFAFVLAELGRFRLDRDGRVLLEQAKSILERTLPSLELICGRSSPQSTRAWTNLGVVARVLAGAGEGDLAAAKAVLRRSAQEEEVGMPVSPSYKRATVYGVVAMGTSASLELGQVAMEDGDWTTAVSALDKASHMREEKVGADGPALVEMFDQLATVYWLKQWPDLSKDMFGRSVEIMERAIPQDNAGVEMRRHYISLMAKPTDDPY